MEDVSQPFQSNPSSVFRARTLGKNCWISNSVIQTVGCGPGAWDTIPAFPLRGWGDFSTSPGPTAGAMAQSPSALQLQRCEGKQGEILAALPEICKHALALQDSPPKYTDMVSPGHGRQGKATKLYMPTGYPDLLGAKKNTQGHLKQHWITEIAFLVETAKN